MTERDDQQHYVLDEHLPFQVGKSLPSGDDRKPATTIDLEGLEHRGITTMKSGATDQTYTWVKPPICPTCGKLTRPDGDQHPIEDFCACPF